MEYYTFYTIQRYNKIPLYQPLCGSWRNATNLFIVFYKFVVIMNSQYNKRDQHGITYVLRKQRYKKIPLYQLPRSGWSVGRAGLGAKATYPA